MRVGLVVPGDLATNTGGYLYDRQLVDYLTAHGDNVEVVTLPRQSYGRDLVHTFSARLAARINEGRFDIVVEDELGHPALAGVNRQLNAGECGPLVALVHLLRSDERRASAWRALYAAVERRYLLGVDAAVFNSAATRASAERLVGRVLPGVVARPACDHLSLPAEDPPVDVPGPLRVVCVANVVPRKAVLPLIGALARLPASSWHLTVVGSLVADPAYVARVRDGIAKRVLGDDITLTGDIPNDEVARHLAASHVLAVPSTCEPAGIAYLEAMRLGLPVIATTVGGAGELVTDGREGFLVEPGDAEALAGCLRRFAADRELVRRMGAAARRRADRHPTWEQSLGPVRELLLDLVARRTDAPRRTA